ncbi:MAG: NADH ubiquinone oxidoreductase chain A [Candidatus Kapaibacterium sp.]|jgi:NADH-quinone oxidoreductase subunit A|nr:MAG: NADH ubiquinone oxidoreductase chain A [Candidatus Kapabacteria bacterium]ROL58414.1 MAG: NADH-quinone oxidoreductase subunit A [Bacteroidetes/Chlorobi group bacterium Naka2016]
MLTSYIPLILMVLFGFAIAFVFMILSEWMGARRVTREKITTYESGMIPFRTARERFSVKFYLIAMSFIVFDIEVVFLYPWAVSFNWLDSAGFWAMIIFIVILFAGYYYELKKGGLQWD